MIGLRNRVFFVMCCALLLLAALPRISQAQRVVDISVKVVIVTPFAPNPVAAGLPTTGVVALTSDDPNVRQEMANVTDPWVNPPVTWSWQAKRNGTNDIAHATIASWVDPGVDPFQATVTASFALEGSWVVSANGAASFSIPHSSDIFQGSATGVFPAVAVVGVGPSVVAEYQPADAVVYPILDNFLFDTWHGSSSVFHLEVYDNQQPRGAFAPGTVKEEFGYFWCIDPSTKDPNDGRGPSSWAAPTFTDNVFFVIITGSTNPPPGWTKTGGVFTTLEYFYQRWHVLTADGDFTLNTHLLDVAYGLQVGRTDATFR